MGRRVTERKITPPWQLHDNLGEKEESADNLEKNETAFAAKKPKNVKSAAKEDTRRGSKGSTKKKRAKEIEYDDDALELNAPNDDIGISENEEDNNLQLERHFSISDVEKLFLENDKFFNQLMDKKRRVGTSE